MLQSIMRDSYLCIHECIYCAQGWPSKRQKSWTSNHGIILPKKKWHNCLQKVQCFYPTHHISPERKLHKPHNSTCWKIRIYIPDHNLILSLDLSLCTYLRLGLLLPHQHWLPLEISRGFRACRFRWTLTGALRKGSQTSWWMARPLLSEEIQLSGGCQKRQSLPENGLRQGWYLQDNDKLQIVHYWEFGPSIGSYYRPALRYLNSYRTLEGMLVVYTVYYVCGIYGLHIYDARIKGPFVRPEYFSPKGPLEKTYL